MYSTLYSKLNSCINYNIDFQIPCKYLLLTSIITILFLIIITIIIFIVISYFVFKFCKIGIENNNILFYDYNKKSQIVLNKYGNYKIKKIYLIRQPFSKILTCGLNILTLYNYEKLIKESEDNFPYHTLILFEIKIPILNKNKNKINQKQTQKYQSKFLILEKNNCICIRENFLITENEEMKQIHFNNKQLTINQILNQTQLRMGDLKYFNWNLYQNNCQEFIKEILITIEQYSTSNHEFIFHDKLTKLLLPSDFIIHICNCVVIIYNMLEKYCLN